MITTVPPRWIVEPSDKAFALGSDARLECKADGFPKPSLGWKKAAGRLFLFFGGLGLNILVYIRGIEQCEKSIFKVL